MNAPFIILVDAKSFFEKARVFELEIIVKPCRRRIQLSLDLAAASKEFIHRLMQAGRHPAIRQ